MRALRRDRIEPKRTSRATWPNCSSLLAPAAGQQLIAMPGAGTQVPIWLLGSSLFSARLAAERGLPYAFASHFAPRLLLQALELYRSRSAPRPAGQALCDDRRAADRRAHRRRSRVPRQQHLPARARHPAPATGAPAAAGGGLHGRGCIPQERAGIADFLAAAVIGGPDTVRAGLARLAEITQADEFMLVCDIFDPALRLRSLDIAAPHRPNAAAARWPAHVCCLARAAAAAK
jgi:alkanesulfonate monooxygenase SsuD/methylene tetrahydromethanopterin reductase-like flavin-dependent oxidoreductase (luciferase family)